MRVSKKLPAIQQLIDRLQERGFRTRLRHEADDVGPIATICTIEYDSDMEGPQPSFEGDAVCHPNDQFDRAKGTQLAFQRALKRLSQFLGRKQMKALLARDA